MAQFRRSEPFEFLKNSINIDKFTGYFDKLLKIFEGKCGKLRGNAGLKISLPLKLREDTTLREACTRRQLRGIARSTGAPPDTLASIHAPDAFCPVTY